MSPPERGEPELKAVRAQAWCLILFGWGLLGLNYPWLAIVNRPGVVLGVPVLVFYLFGAWALLILALSLLMRRLRRHRDLV